MTDQELKEWIARMNDLTAEAKREQIELSKAQRETARQIKQVNKQIGEIGNKFGYFTEGMALPSMEKVLKNKFGMNAVFPRAKYHKNGHTLEIDVLSYDSTKQNDAAYLVEVKSNLTKEAIDQLLDTIEKFPQFAPDLADRKLYGIVAAVYIPDDLRNVVLKNGLYLARISDDTFRLQVPPNFKPKVFGENGHRKNGASKRAKRSK